MPLNDLGRQILVDAALKGRHQIYSKLHSGTGSCALGQFHLAKHDYDEMKAIMCQSLQCVFNAYEEVGLVGKEQCCVCTICENNENPLLFNEKDLILHLNDVHQLDFLTIARKV